MMAILNKALRAFVTGVGLLLLWQGTAAIVSAQNSAAGRTESIGQTAGQEVPTVSFVFDHPQIAPNHFEITVNRSGKGSYVSHSDPQPDDQSARLKDEDLQRPFLLSQRTLERIFDLVKTARYLDGQFDYTKSKIAFTGKKTLSYKDKSRQTSTTFNWSENQAIDELGSIFLGISATLESGARLEHMLQHEKLALNSELASLEQQTRSRQSREIGLIAPVLQQIAADDSVMTVARRRAERLLAAAENEKQGSRK